MYLQPPWGVPRAPWGLLGVPSGAVWSPSGCSRGLPGVSRDSLWGPLGLSRDSLGTPRGLPGTPRDSLGTPRGPPRYSPGSPGTPRGPVGLSRDSLGTPQRIPGRRTLKRMQRCCPMVLHRAVLQRARFERWVVSRVLPLIRFILKRASPPPITHRTYRRSGPVGDPEGGYIGRPRSMDMKCHHKIGREIWEWGMAEPFVV